MGEAPAAAGSPEPEAAALGPAMLRTLVTVGLNSVGLDTLLPLHALTSLVLTNCALPPAPDLWDGECAAGLAARARVRWRWWWCWCGRWPEEAGAAPCTLPSPLAAPSARLSDPRSGPAAVIPPRALAPRYSGPACLLTALAAAGATPSLRHLFLGGSKVAIVGDEHRLARQRPPASLPPRP